MTELLLGANLPWIRYGQDFGASAWRPQGGVAQPDLREHMRRALGTLADAGASLVRWWLLADGRSGLRLDREGRPEGVDAFVFADLDAAVEALREAGLRAIFVLSDFLWFRRPKRMNGVQLYGRRQLVRGPENRRVLVEAVLGPLGARYAREPAIAAWDLLNEPDWATFGVGCRDPCHSVTRRTMRAYLSELATAFHGCGTQPVTVGLARSSALPLVQGLGLDLYQVHWYPSQDSLLTLAQPVSARGLDRPLLLGEFPTAGAVVLPERVLSLAAGAGYQAALAWSLLARDDATDGRACESALATWACRPAAGQGTA